MKVKYFNKPISELDKLEKEVNEWLEKYEVNIHIESISHIPSGEGADQNMTVSLWYEEYESGKYKKSVTIQVN